MTKQKHISKKIKVRNAIYEMMDDMIRWEFEDSFGDRSLLDVLRKKYIIRLK